MYFIDIINNFESYNMGGVREIDPLVSHGGT